MKKKIPFWIAIATIIIVAVIASAVIFKAAAQPEMATYEISVSTSTSNATATALYTSMPGGPCGGNTTHPRSCPDGYQCEPAPNSHAAFGDVGGICVQVSATATVPSHPIGGCTTVNGHTICY